MHRTLGVTARAAAVVAALGLGGVAAAQNTPAPAARVPQFPQQTPEEKARFEATMAAFNKLPDPQGTGAYPALKEEDPSLPAHTVYRPKDLAKIGKGALGIVAWGNGACAADGAGQRMHLLELASHGYVVIAPGGIHSGPGSTPLPPPPPDAPRFTVATTTEQVKEGLEWALAQNARPGSAYYGKIDPAKIAVSGFSCGGIQAIELAGDPRVKAVIIDNSGVFPDDFKFIQGIKATKATLLTYHTPVLYILGGPTDIAFKNGMDDYSRIAHVPVMAAINEAGHGGDFLKVNGGPSAHTAALWLEWQLRGDKKAGAYFVGADCGLCKEPGWKVERKNFPTAP